MIGGPLNKGLSLGAMYASASAGGSPLSFISGGSYQYAGGMVIFNSSNAASPSWKNVTSDDLPYLRGSSIYSLALPAPNNMFESLYYEGKRRFPLSEHHILDHLATDS